MPSGAKSDDDDDDDDDESLSKRKMYPVNNLLYQGFPVMLCFEIFDGDNYKKKEGI